MHPVWSLLVLVPSGLCLASPAAAADASPACGVKGYSRGRNAYDVVNGASSATLNGCGARCSTDAKCASFAFGSGKCYLFDVALSSNVDKVSSSPNTFYDRGCVAVTSTSLRVSVPSTSSRPTAASPTTTPVSTSTCGIIGYDKQSPTAYSILSGSASLTACSSRCKTSPQCKSFAFGSNKCLLYNTRLQGNVNSVAGSPYTFFDMTCISPSSNAPTSTNALSSSIQTSSNAIPAPSLTTLCGLSGYDKQAPQAYDSTSASTLASCTSRCKAQSACRGLVFGAGRCLLYAAMFNGNFRADVGSPYRLYDLGCLVSTSVVVLSTTATVATTSSSAVIVMTTTGASTISSVSSTLTATPSSSASSTLSSTTASSVTTLSESQTLTTSDYTLASTTPITSTTTLSESQTLTTDSAFSSTTSTTGATTLSESQPLTTSDLTLSSTTPVTSATTLSESQTPTTSDYTLSSVTTSATTLLQSQTLTTSDSALSSTTAITSTATLSESQPLTSSATTSSALPPVSTLHCGDQGTAGYTLPVRRAIRTNNVAECSAYCRSFDGCTGFRVRIAGASEHQTGCELFDNAFTSLTFPLENNASATVRFEYYEQACFAQSTSIPATATATGSPTVCTAVNYVVNGGFEAGLGPWTLQGVGFSLVLANGDINGLRSSYEGTYYLQTVGYGPIDIVLSQTLNGLSAGQKVRCSAFFQSAQIDSTLILSVSIGGQACAFVSYISSGQFGWKEVYNEGDITVLQDNPIIEIAYTLPGSGGSRQAVFLDAISVSPVSDDCSGAGISSISTSTGTATTAPATTDSTLPAAITESSTAISTSSTDTLVLTSTSATTTILESSSTSLETSTTSDPPIQVTSTTLTSSDLASTSTTGSADSTTMAASTTVTADSTTQTTFVTLTIPSTTTTSQSTTTTTPAPVPTCKVRGYMSSSNLGPVLSQSPAANQYTCSLLCAQTAGCISFGVAVSSINGAPDNCVVFGKAASFVKKDNGGYYNFYDQRCPVSSTALCGVGFSYRGEASHYSSYDSELKSAASCQKYCKAYSGSDKSLAFNLRNSGQRDTNNPYYCDCFHETVEQLQALPPSQFPNTYWHYDIGCML